MVRGVAMTEMVSEFVCHFQTEVEVNEKRIKEHQSNQEEGGVVSKTVAEREDRGRADEFRVASELCRRKMFAALTIGNVPN